jgi:uncharacterized protein (DUF2141 family)
MNKVKLISVGLLLALGLSLSWSVFAQTEQKAQMSYTILETKEGTWQLVLFLDLNGNGKLEADEPVLRIWNLTSLGDRLPEPPDNY